MYFLLLVVVFVVRDITNYKLHALSMAKISSVESVLNAINTSTSVLFFFFWYFFDCTAHAPMQNMQLSGVSTAKSLR